jgi:hypothetical protein
MLPNTGEGDGIRRKFTQTHYLPIARKAAAWQHRTILVPAPVNSSRARYAGNGAGRGATGACRPMLITKKKRGSVASRSPSPSVAESSAA